MRGRSCLWWTRQLLQRKNKNPALSREGAPRKGRGSLCSGFTQTGWPIAGEAKIEQKSKREEKRKNTLIGRRKSKLCISFRHAISGPLRRGDNPGRVEKEHNGCGEDTVEPSYGNFIVRMCGRRRIMRNHQALTESPGPVIMLTGAWARVGDTGSGQKLGLLTTAQPFITRARRR